MILKKCSECNKTIYLNSKYILYRCCDANVCSYKCSINRFKNIQNYDPELNCPTDWHYLNNTNSSNINYDTKINNSNNLMKRTQSLDNIFKNKLSLDTIFENDNMYKYSEYNKKTELDNIPEYNKKKNLNNIYKFITIRFVALSLLIYNISTLFSQ